MPNSDPRTDFSIHTSHLVLGKHVRTEKMSEKISFSEGFV